MQMTDLPTAGIEPATFCLLGKRSTNELSGLANVCQTGGRVRPPNPVPLNCTAARRVPLFPPVKTTSRVPFDVNNHCIATELRTIRCIPFTLSRGMLCPRCWATWTEVPLRDETTDDDLQVSQCMCIPLKCKQRLLCGEDP